MVFLSLNSRKNAGLFVESAVLSIINQTRVPNEIICIDDGSTDSTFSILKNIEKSNHCIKIIKTDGVGISKALNLAIQCAENRYLARMDADDLSHFDRWRSSLILQRKSRDRNYWWEYKVFWQSRWENICSAKFAWMFSRVVL